MTKLTAKLSVVALALLGTGGQVEALKVPGAFVPKEKHVVASAALDIPRGGNNVADASKNVYCAMLGIHGLISVLAPEETPKLLYNDSFEIEKDSLGSVWLELVGSTFIGCVYMALLAFSSDMDAATIIAHGTYPCALLNLRNLLKDNYAEKGFTKGLGLFMTLGTFGIPAAIRSGRFDSDLLAKVNLIVPLGVGLLGNIDLASGKKVLGLGEADGVTDAMARWSFCALAQWGIIGLALLMGQGAAKAIGYSTLFFLAMVLDSNYIRKSNEPLNIKPAVSVVFAIVLSTMSYGFLVGSGMDQSVPSPTD